MSPTHRQLAFKDPTGVPFMWHKLRPQHSDADLLIMIAEKGVCVVAYTAHQRPHVLGLFASGPFGNYP
jgi:hypothetical protein